MTADFEWCLVANVKPEAFGRATAPGTRHFRAGAKLWCLPPRWGEGYETIDVIGRHRGSSRDHVVMAVFSKYLTNWRAKAAHHPGVLERIRSIRRWPSVEVIQQVARELARVHPPVADLAERAAVLRHALRAIADDPVGRGLAERAAAVLATWSQAQRLVDAAPPFEVTVLGDWLEQHGAALPISQLVETLDRQRVNPRARRTPAAT